ncbi:MAG: hypothetical protein OXF79_11655 [Chloroflexi bacterium]|nr:hypothetical protein [Chloroflexota bacterium]
MTNPMKRYLRLAAALSALTCLFWFALACGGDEPETADAPDYEATVAAAVANASVFAPTIEPTATAEPTPSPTPTDIPPTPATPTAAPGAQSTGGAEPLAPLAIDDANAFLADLSEAERSCLSGAMAPERLAAVLSDPQLADDAERATVLDCLQHETSLRLLLTPVLSATGPLSPESSECLRSSYAATDLRALMATLTAASDPGSPGEASQVAGMVTFVVSLSCLSEEEFQVAAPAMGIAPGERENFQCVLEKVGGQDALTLLLTPAAAFPAELFEAIGQCQLQLAGPPPG